MRRVLDIDDERQYVERCFGITHAHVTGDVLCLHPSEHSANQPLYTENLRADTSAVQRDISCFLIGLPVMQRACRSEIYRLLLYRCKLEKQKRKKREAASAYAYEHISRKISANAASISSRVYDLLETILHGIGLSPRPYLVLSKDLWELERLEAGNILRRAVKKAFIAEETYGALENILHGTP